MTRDGNYQLLKDIYTATGKLEDKVDKRFDEVSGQIDGIRNGVNQRMIEVDKRIDTLEIWKTEIKTKISMGVAFISLAFNIIWELIQTKFFNRKGS